MANKRERERSKQGERKEVESIWLVSFTASVCKRTRWKQLPSSWLFLFTYFLYVWFEETWWGEGLTQTVCFVRDVSLLPPARYISQWKPHMNMDEDWFVYFVVVRWDTEAFNVVSDITDEKGNDLAPVAIERRVGENVKVRSYQWDFIYCSTCNIESGLSAKMVSQTVALFTRSSLASLASPCLPENKSACRDWHNIVIICMLFKVPSLCLSIRDLQVPLAGTQVWVDQ